MWYSLLYISHVMPCVGSAVCRTCTVLGSHVDAMLPITIHLWICHVVWALAQTRAIVNYYSSRHNCSAPRHLLLLILHFALHATIQISTIRDSFFFSRQFFGCYISFNFYLYFYGLQKKANFFSCAHHFSVAISI